MRLVSLATLVVLAGCFDFEDRTEVKDLRVLAVSVEPPEVMVPFALGEDPPIRITADPAPVQVRMLVVDPERPAEPLTFTVTACEWNQDLRCDQSEVALPFGGGAGAPEVLTFTFAPDAAALNRWLPEDQFRGYGGLYVLLDVDLRRGPERLRAAKVVTYNVPFVPKRDDQDPPPPKLANRNPVLDGLKFDDRESRIEDELLEMEAGRKYTLTPLFDRPQQIERYPVATFPDPRTGTGPGYRVLEEKLQFEFYATGGKIGEADVETRTPIGDTEKLESSWTAPEKRPEKDIVLWVVTRDDRGGSSWTRRVLRVR